MKPVVAIAMALLLGGCFSAAQTQYTILRADANGIVIRAGNALSPDKYAILHCQHFNKIMVPVRVERIKIGRASWRERVYI